MFLIVRMSNKGPHKLVTREKTLQAARDTLERITRPYKRNYDGLDRVVTTDAIYGIFED